MVIDDYIFVYKCAKTTKWICFRTFIVFEVLLERRLDTYKVDFARGLVDLARGWMDLGRGLVDLARGIEDLARGFDRFFKRFGEFGQEACWIWQEVSNANEI
jgi:hypothetical protein